MNLLNKLTIKNLKLNKKRTIVTIIGIMLSVALITAVASMYASGIKSLISFEIKEQGNYHMAYFDVPIIEVTTLKNNRSIDNIAITKNIGYANIDTENEYKPYAFIKGLTKDSLDDLGVNLVEGRLPENNNEIVIPTHLKTSGRNFLNVGDTIILNVGKRVDSEGLELSQNDAIKLDDDSTLNEKIINTQEITYKIVGIIERLPKSVEPFSAPGFTFVTTVDESSLIDNVDIYVKYTKSAIKDWIGVTANILGVDEEILKMAVDEKDLDSTALEKIDNELKKAKYNTYANSYLIELETNPLTLSGIDSLGIVLVIVLLIIVVTSVFCIKNSFDISITEKIKQYGMLRSIGATKKQIKKNVFYEATILGLIGIPLGILLGCFASFILIIVSNYFLKGAITGGMKLELDLSVIAILIAIILGIITIYLSALRSALKASKVSPIDSIRNSANIKIKSKNVKSPKIIKKIFGIGGDISYKNLKRNKKKYRTTVISIAISVLVFIALSSFMQMMFNEAKTELNASDYNISLSANINNNKDRYNKYIATLKLDNILDYTFLRTYIIKLNDIKFNQEYIDRLGLSYNDLINSDGSAYINVYALGKEQYNKYIKSLGLNYDDIKNKAILMDYSSVSKYNESTKKLEYKNMRIYDYKKGDVLNNIDDNNNILIGYITDKKPFGFSTFNGEYLIVSDEYFDELLSMELVHDITIFYKSSDANKLQDDIDELLKGDSYYRIDNIQESFKVINNLLTLIAIFLYGFIIVISLIGITNIFNTITTNMELRKPEFAMLKSIGMTSREFNTMIRLETLFMGIKSLLFGIPIGLILSYLMYYLLENDSRNNYCLPIIPIIISIIVVFILISIIMKYSMKKISKQNTIETIRNENI